MRALHAIVGIRFAIGLSTLAYALKNPPEVFLNWDPPVHALQFSLLTCDEACRCTDACAHTNYNNRRLQCELVRRIQPDRSLYFEMRAGFIKTDKHALIVSRNASKETSGECSRIDAAICPDIVIDDATLVLDNLTTITDQRLIQLTWSPGLDGWKTASCKSRSKCTDYDTRKTESTMREACQSDGECVDAESECRDGQCWCKPGLSHDPDSLSCVALCPGQYGSTFQEVKNHYDMFFDRGNYYANSVTNKQSCMDMCLEAINPNSTWYTCKLANYVSNLCSFKEIPANREPNLYKVGLSGMYVLLLRDCTN